MGNALHLTRNQGQGHGGGATGESRRGHWGGDGTPTPHRGLGLPRGAKGGAHSPHQTPRVAEEVAPMKRYASRLPQSPQRRTELLFEDIQEEWDLWKRDDKDPETAAVGFAKATETLCGEVQWYVHVLEEVHERSEEANFNIYQAVMFAEREYCRTNGSCRNFAIIVAMAMGVLAIEVLAPLAVMIAQINAPGFLILLESEDGWLDTSTGEAWSRLAIFAVNIYFCLTSLVSSLNAYDTIHKKSTNELEAAFGYSVIYEASYAKLLGLSDSSATQKAFAWLDCFMNMFWPHVLAVEVFFLIWNARSAIDIVLNFLALENIHQMDEIFFEVASTLINPSYMKANIVLNAVSADHSRARRPTAIVTGKLYDYFNRIMIWAPFPLYAIILVLMGVFY